ncbi:MAG: hypothetical protein IPN06_08830 [Burkholderiales bacterium]|nr:hypothetical protein [Burkholderiales bacterium]
MKTIDMDLRAVCLQISPPTHWHTALAMACARRNPAKPLRPFHAACRAKEACKAHGQCAEGFEMRTRFAFPKLLPALLLSLSLLGACSSSPHAAQPSERQAKAMAMWQERCKTAGEKIYKTVENVEGSI